MGTLTFYFTILLKIGLIAANCVLNIKDDLTVNQPLILAQGSSKWVSLSDSNKGSLHIGRDDIVKLVCPPGSNKNSFQAADLSNHNFVMAKCKSGKGFEVNNKVYQFTDLLCKSSVEVSQLPTGKECLGKDTELIKVGFNDGSNYISEYEVCFEKKERFTLYTESVVSPHVDKSTISNRDHTWLPKSSDLFRNIDLNSVYSSNKQEDTFKRILNKNFFDNNKCYLEKGKLVPKDTMVFLPEQASTFHYLNVVPQWSTCNRANWIEVEKRVKNLAVSMNKPLTVWSGTYRKMSLPAKWGFSHKDLYLHYNGDSDKAIPVPLYIWKVVYDPSSQKAVAIIQINNPHMTISEVDSFVLCDDICKNVNWLNFLERKTIVDGYVYCCDLPNFEHGFAFRKSPFQRARGGILRDDNKRG